MSYCLFNTAVPPWKCEQCEWEFRDRHGNPIASVKPPIRSCPNSPDITEAAERLGITGDDIKHWAQALARWTAAGFPTRSQAEVERIESEICRPCKQYVDGRCKKCGCRVNTSRVAVANKVKLKTEICPEGKWGSRPEQQETRNPT